MKLTFREKLKYKYLKFFYYQRRKIDTFFIRQGIKKTIKNFPQFEGIKKDKEYLANCEVFLKKNFNGYKNTNWHHFYHVVTGRKETEHIPSDLYFTQIEPTLNKLDFSKANSDKNSYDLFFRKSEIPETIFKIINNTFFDAVNNPVQLSDAICFLESTNGNLVLKPTIDSGGGKNVVIDSATKIIDSIQSNDIYKKGSFIVQVPVKQSSEIGQFHPTSLNTCRLMTARKGSEIIVLSAYLKIGRNKSTVDNVTNGALICKINNNGALDKYAYTRKKLKIDQHPDTKIKFENFVIPNYEKVKEICLRYHKKMLRHTFISWDIGINENNLPIIIELNLKRQTIHGHQIVNGPLFGEHTQYFIKKFHTEKNKKNLEFI